MCITLSLVGMDIHEQHVGEREGAEELDITSSLLRMDMHERPYMSSTYVSKYVSLFPLRRAREGRRGVRGYGRYMYYVRGVCVWGGRLG